MHVNGYTLIELRLRLMLLQSLLTFPIHIRRSKILIVRKLIRFKTYKKRLSNFIISVHKRKNNGSANIPGRFVYICMPRFTVREIRSRSAFSIAQCILLPVTINLRKFFRSRVEFAKSQLLETLYNLKEK